MKTGLTKQQKTTVIFFDEQGDMIEVQTHNTDLKNEIRKGRLSFRLTAPYSKERCQKCSDLAKKHTKNLKGAQK